MVIRQGDNNAFDELDWSNALRSSEKGVWNMHGIRNFRNETVIPEHTRGLEKTLVNEG